MRPASRASLASSRGIPQSRTAPHSLCICLPLTHRPPPCSRGPSATSRPALPCAHVANSRPCPHHPRLPRESRPSPARPHATLERASRTPARRRRPSDDDKLRVSHPRPPRAAAASPRRGGTPHPRDTDDDIDCRDDDMMPLDSAPVDERPPPRSARLPVSSFLSPGQRFSGSQTVNQAQSKGADEWRVNVHIQDVDYARGTVCGSMEALDVPKAVLPVVTFWQGEIVDNSNYYFWTGRWDAEVEHDVDHWKKFVGFAHLQARVRRDRGDDIDLSASRYIFMRWKEIFFVSPGEDCGLTIAGFYYVCLDRITGAMLGYYYDPNSAPYQRLQLNAVSLPGGHAFSTYQFN